VSTWLCVEDRHSRYFLRSRSLARRISASSAEQADGRKMEVLDPDGGSEM